MNILRHIGEIYGLRHIHVTFQNGYVGRAPFVIPSVIVIAISRRKTADKAAFSNAWARPRSEHLWRISQLGEITRRVLNGREMPKSQVGASSVADASCYLL